MYNIIWKLGYISCTFSIINLIVHTIGKILHTRKKNVLEEFRNCSEIEDMRKIRQIIKLIKYFKFCCLFIVYDNVVRKISWSKRDEPAESTSKADIHRKKVMLSVWWDFKGLVHFELLSRNQTINSNVYCRQLKKLDK